jgi:hypothetical protein
MTAHSNSKAGAPTNSCCINNSIADPQATKAAATT